MQYLELLFFVALVLYTSAIMSHKFKKKLKPWMMVLFGIGLAADICGTVFLCAFSSNSWQWTLHSISGFVSLLIMALHFFWALIAILKGGKFEDKFNQWSIYAWLLWLVAFFSGIPLH